MVIKEDRPDKPLLFVRIGSLGEKELLRVMGDSIAGVVVGANMVEAAKASISPFLRALGRPYVIDPMFHLFTINIRAVHNPETHKIKSSYSSLATKYGGVVGTAVGKESLSAEILLKSPDTMRDITVRVLGYQKEVLSCAPSFADYYAEFEKFLPKARPAMLLPPYLAFSRYGDARYKLSLEFARMALAVKPSSMFVYPVIVIPQKALEREDSIKPIVDDYGVLPADGYWVWASGLSETVASRTHLANLATLVAELARNGRPILKLYGGYYSSLLFGNGLVGFSCGLGYGEAKEAHAYGGRAKPPEPRYYVPLLHKFVDLARAQYLLERYPELRCKCPVCLDTYGNNLGNFPMMAEARRQANHYLNVRIRELEILRTVGQSGIFEEIWETLQRYRDELFIETAHLMKWHDVLAPVRAY